MADTPAPLFNGRWVVETKHIEKDLLWRLLATGKATEEDQRYAAGWIAYLTAPKNERCPTCGEPVVSIFEHVDRDGDCEPTAYAAIGAGHLET